jgi:hypothetical protein
MMWQFKHWHGGTLEIFFSRPYAFQQTFAWIGFAAAALLPGCMSTAHTDSATVFGGGLGAMTGALIGHESGHAAGGAVIGALAGGLAGGLIGNAQDMREERDAAVMHARYLEETGQLLSNKDVIRMVQYGLSDDVIIGTVMNSAGRYDLSADATMLLKAYGTSDRVILTLQKAPQIRSASAVRAATAAPTANVGVVVAPYPLMMFGPLRPRHHYYSGPYYHRGCR